MDTTMEDARYGAPIRSEFLLDPAALTVNHGSYGATPRVVLEAQEEWRRRLELQPMIFMKRVLPDALAAATARLAAFVGASVEDLVFVENATVGCNAVFRSMHLGPGDEIVAFQHGYAAVRNAARYAAQRAGAKLVEVVLPFPRPDDAAIVESFRAALTPGTRLAVIDHITAPSALLLPVEALVKAAREAGAAVLVDGAHAPGQVSLDVQQIGADWYVGNCHKWLFAPKGCGFLWASKKAQEDLHPVTISHGYGKGFHAEFDWTGTRDPSAYLTIPDALDFYERIGGAGLRAHNDALAAQAAKMLVHELGTECSARPSQMVAMASLRLPLGGPATPERALEMRAYLLDNYRCDAPVHPLAGGLWLRISAQAYNAMSDYERLADVIRDIAGKERT